MDHTARAKRCKQEGATDAALVSITQQATCSRRTRPAGCCLSTRAPAEGLLSAAERGEVPMTRTDSPERADTGAVIVDNSTLISCRYLVQTGRDWESRLQSDEDALGSIRTLVDCLIFQDHVYVDADVLLKNPTCIAIADLFSGLISGMSLEEGKKKYVYDAVSRALSENLRLRGQLSALARLTEFQPVRRISQNHRVADPVLDDYLSEPVPPTEAYPAHSYTIDRVFFKTCFYLVLSGEADIPYAPHSFRHYLAQYVSSFRSLHQVDSEMQPHFVAQRILQSFEREVGTLHDGKITEVQGFAHFALTMPSLYDYILRKANGRQELFVEEICRIRNLASTRAFRQFVKDICRWKKEGQRGRLAQVTKELEELKGELQQELALPKFRKKYLKVRKWFEVEIPLLLPNPRKRYQLFLYRWIAREL